MSIPIVFVMLVAAVSMAFGFMPANVQQPQRAQRPQSLRLYVLDCGKITPANADAYGLKSSEMATVNVDGRSLSLSGGDHVEENSVLRHQQGADREEPRDDRRIRETESRAAVDTARLHFGD